MCLSAAPTDVGKDGVCGGLDWAVLGYGTCQYGREKDRVGGRTDWGINCYVYSLVCGFDRPNLSLHQMAHPRVESEVTLGKVSWETSQPDCWTQTQATGKATNYIVQLCNACIGTGLPQFLMP